MSLALIISACSKSLIPIPGSIVPEYSNKRLSAESYGEYPKNYQKILKDFLQQKLLNHESAKVEFINKPSQSSITQMGTDYNGYRLCLSINSKNGKSIYTGFKTHLFLIWKQAINSKKPLNFEIVFGIDMESLFRTKVRKQQLKNMNESTEARCIELTQQHAAVIEKS